MKVYKMTTHRSSRGVKVLRVLFLLAAVIAGIHVWLDELYQLKLHVALGYGDIFSKNMVFQLLTRYLGALLYAGLGALSIVPIKSVLRGPYEQFYAPLKYLFALIGWGIGYSMWSLDATSWFLFFKHSQFHRADPILHTDYAFYVYVLPLVVGLIGRLIGTILLFGIVRGLILMTVLFNQESETRQDIVKPIQRQARTVVLLIGVLFLCFAALAYLSRFNTVLTSGNGSFIFGPDFVTTHLTLPVFSWLTVALLLVVMGLFFSLAVRIENLFANKDGFVVLKRRALKRPVVGVSVLIVQLILSPIANALVNGVYVHPNQNVVELPYIKNTIDATRYATGIENVGVQAFNPQTTLTPSAVNREANSLTNVRINDQGQTTAIYNQLQSFKSYFTFSAATVDRYDGYEVYTSARQMNTSNLPVKTWVNQTLVYTHGYGLAMSPVNQFDQNGLPVLWAKNTPQQTVAPLPTITRPEIYFGTTGNDVIAPSKQGEFDYPLGSQDHTSHYAGGYGMPIEGNRWLLALEQGNLKYFTSDQITSQSLWLFDRNIYNRVQDIAPFLHYDHDAFPFVDTSGHIEWMLDAYTESNSIPYAQQFADSQYIRNSVKVVMDAYTGKVTFYVVDKTDPLLTSLRETYPSLFTDAIPADVAAHFRYPIDLFQAQAEALTRYHMTDAAAFYNQEDLWSIANQIYDQNSTEPRPPVYQEVRMPDRSAPQLVLSALFTPTQKDNLNGWFIADNEPGMYGQLTLYQFPQSSLIFGPMQAENQIDSNPTISSQLTLWNQQGSHVVRGDLLLVPVGNAIMYVEPIYLVANRENSLPQLERVVIDFNQKVYIDNTLAAAVQDIFGGAQNMPTPTAPGTSGTPPKLSDSENQLVQSANQWFQRYQSDTAKGDFTAAGNDLKNLGAALNDLAKAKQAKSH